MNVKNLISTLLLLCQAGSVLAAPDAMFWFKNDSICAGQKIVIRSYCEVSEHDEEAMQSNTMCSEQELVVTSPQNKTVRVDLLAREPWRGDMHTARSMHCIVGEKQALLVFSYANGGNCHNCELDAVMNTSGKWLRYGNKWFTAGARYKKQIEAQMADWYNKSAVPILNTVKE